MKYIIFGSGGMAKEVIGYVESDGHEVIDVISTEVFEPPWWDDRYVCEQDHRPSPATHACLMAVADPGTKRAIHRKWPQAQWETFAHSSAYISPHAIIGRGCIFAPGAIVAGDPVIENFCFFNTNATIGHDSRLGAYSTLFPNTEVCGNCDIGEGVIFGIGAYAIPGVTLADGCKVSAGAIVRESHHEPATIYGDPRGEHRIKPHREV